MSSSPNRALDRIAAGGQGTTDLQVDTTEALVLRRARGDAAYLQVTGMNHVLKLATGGLAEQRASYSDSTLAIAPALIAGVAAFVHGVADRRGRITAPPASAPPGGGEGP
jgi:hypothetical protein